MIDTHTHLFVEEFAEDLSSVIQRAKEAGVKRVFMPNIDDESLEEMMKVCVQFPGFCYPMLGYHPTSVDASSMEKVRQMKKYLVPGHPFIAIGEVGLDLYWDQTFLHEQKMVLDEQIKWALEWNLPLVVHCREAFAELFEMLKPYKATGLKGVFHSFTGTMDEANEAMEYDNFMLGINGVVTFKKSALPAVLKRVPLERLVLETDSPYLAPSPYRGRRNESSYIVKVADKLAEIYELSASEICSITTENALKVFKISD